MLRFACLVTIQAFAAERMAATPDEERAARQRHAVYFTEWVAANNDKTTRINGEIPNIRAALEWLDTQDVARHRRLTLASIQPAVLVWRDVAARHPERSLGRPESDAERVPLLLAKTEMLQRMQEDESIWRPIAEETEAAARRIGDEQGLAYVLCLRIDSRSHLDEAASLSGQGRIPAIEAFVVMHQARYAFWNNEPAERWRALFRRALQLSSADTWWYQELYCRIVPEHVRYEWGYALLHRGDLAEAEPLLVEAVKRCGLGNTNYGHPQWMLARLYMLQGNLERALPLAEEAVEATRRAGWNGLLITALTVLSTARLWMRDSVGAAACLQEVDDLIAALGGEAAPWRNAPLWVCYYLWQGEHERARAVVEPFAFPEPPSTPMSAVHYSSIRQAWGRVLLAQGEAQAALVALGDSLRARRTFGSFPAVCDDVEAIVAARLDLALLSEADAATLLAAVEAARTRLGTPLSPWLDWLRERTAFLLQRPDLSEARAVGSRLTLDEAADRVAG